MALKLKQSDVLLIVTTIYYVLINMSDLVSFGNVLLVLSMVLFFFYNIWTNHGKAKLVFNKFHLYILCFMLFTLASSTWATDASLTMPKFNAMLFILLAMIVVTMNNNDDNAIDRLCKCLLYGNYCVVLISILIFGWGNIIEAISDNIRYSKLGINANQLGMCGAYAIIINFHYILNLRKKLVVSDVLMVPTLITIIASGSRKAILMIAIGFFGLLLLRRETKIRVILMRTLIALPILAVIIWLLSKIESMQIIFGRVSDLVNLINGNATRYNNTAWLRFEYIKLGFDLFKEHPLLGVGIGNSNYYTLLYYGNNHYLHNNFMELLGCGGIVGFVLYYSIYLSSLRTLLRNREQKRTDVHYDFCLILLVIMIINGIALVQYFSKSTYFFLLLIWLETRKVKSRKQIREAGV